MKTIEQWRDEKHTPAWVFAGLRVAYPSGSEMTAEQYDAACDAVKNHVPGRAPTPKENA